MPLEIAVGPPQLVVHVGQTAWIADPDGQVRSGAEKGLIFRDTRLISAWELYANGECLGSAERGCDRALRRPGAPHQPHHRDRGRRHPRAHARPRARPLDRAGHPRGHRHHQPRPRPGPLQSRTRAARRLRRHLRGEIRPASSAAAASPPNGTTSRAMPAHRLPQSGFPPRAEPHAPRRLPGRLRQRAPQLRDRARPRRHLARLPALRARRRRRAPPGPHRLHPRLRLVRAGAGALPAGARKPLCSTAANEQLQPHLPPGGGRPRCASPAIPGQRRRRRHARARGAGRRPALVRSPCSAATA